ncbi:sodium:proton antiporter [Flavobacterium piscis]|uniref:NhaP-type Na+/H+ or K+/H+ antiporter n=1 Tax=Flavobacterium piscis TaxID=1114874 RepID=A0ABU1YBJ5_9FLAO|nr:sodium:proton antiporter [Flavobacterium piscis]MDR7210985.1 NhaP-type Na+/H+ or K+/H+ antiporter [Flavobacterium piscis]
MYIAMMKLLNLESYNYYLLAGGIITLLAAIIPNVFEKKHLTPPIIYLFIGIVIAFAGRRYTDFDVMQHSNIIRRVSEFVVIIALTNAGLKIKKPFSWETWKYSFRLLLITMPLTIIGAAYAGWWLLGLAPAAAVLFGALISPTDPVLASELQTSRPSKKDLSKIRLGLTSEAGLNDGLAFPFTYFAIFLAANGHDYSQWIGKWFYIEVLYKIAVGGIIGLLAGWFLYKLIFKITSESYHSGISQGILSLALTLLPYGLTELLGGYGFIAVFIAACAFSNSEDKVKHMDTLHDFTEEIERIFVAFLFIFVGIYVYASVDELLDFMTIATALIVLFIIRPLSGWIALYRTDLSAFEKFALSFYGIRGVGSIFYLMYAFEKANFPNSYELIRVSTVVIVLSVLIHGLSAAMMQKKLK